LIIYCNSFWNYFFVILTLFWTPNENLKHVAEGVVEIIKPLYGDLQFHPIVVQALTLLLQSRMRIIAKKKCFYFFFQS